MCIRRLWLEDGVDAVILRYDDLLLEKVWRDIDNTMLDV